MRNLFHVPVFLDQVIQSPFPEIIPISVDGAINQPTGHPNGPDAEITLDITIAASIAPGAKIIVYFAPNTTAGFFNAVSTAIYDKNHRLSVLSISWGKPEKHWTLQAMYEFNRIFLDAAMRGITICCAVGDEGSTNGVNDGFHHVSFPASSPYVLACGGTRLEGSGSTIKKETVWNDGQGNATGGGISNIFDLPSWQANFPIPEKINSNGKKGRGIPDVAGNADPHTGYKMFLHKKMMINGGTSAVAPLWAGLISIINQQLGYSVGFINPLLYHLSTQENVFRDIIHGNNHPTKKQGLYSAQKGWDACTGLGSPNASRLIHAIDAFYSV
ncbi:S8 family serine peptidase [Bacillus cereus]